MEHEASSLLRSLECTVFLKAKLKHPLIWVENAQFVAMKGPDSESCVVVKVAKYFYIFNSNSLLSLFILSSRLLDSLSDLLWLNSLFHLLIFFFLNLNVLLSLAKRLVVVPKSSQLIIPSFLLCLKH